MSCLLWGDPKGVARLAVILCVVLFYCGLVGKEGVAASLLKLAVQTITILFRGRFQFHAELISLTQDPLLNVKSSLNCCLQTLMIKDRNLHRFAKDPKVERYC